MNRYVALTLAICTVCGMAAPWSAYAGDTAASENLAGYEETLVQWGASVLTLPAQLEYRAARIESKRGDAQAAQAHLERAIALDPQWPDPYFTMSWLKFRHLDPDALYHLVGGFGALWRNFHAQSLLAVNSVVVTILVLLIAASIVSVAFAVRYFPFVAYRLGEMFESRSHVALARTAAYFVILIPFALFPGFITGVCFLILLTWHFMHRRERFVMVLLIAPFVVLGILAPRIERFGSVADPGSFTSLAAVAASSAGDSRMIRTIASAPAPDLEVEKHNALGLLRMRQEDYDAAANHFLAAIAQRPDDPIAYINLGNVYYLRGMYEKALEGYRKAERLAPLDAVGQYNLAQAYIKTLLMAESSKALRGASAAGIDKVERSYAEMVRPTLQVYAKTFSNAELWSMAQVEGASRPAYIVDSVVAVFGRFGARTSAWLLLGALLVTLLLSRWINQRHLAFQCSNCGDITSESTCSAQRGTFICQACAAAIASVSSDKVVDALLRQRRQAVLVRRRRGIRFLTMWLPGMRDIFYGRLTRGLFLSTLAAFCVVQLWSKGYIIKDWNTLELGTPAWKWILPTAGIVYSYVMSLLARSYFEVRNYRSPSLRQRGRPASEEVAEKSASA